MAMKRQSIKNKNVKIDGELDSLFKPDGAADEKPAAKKDDEKEIKLRGFDKIRDYYLDIDGGEQYTVYLPPELHHAFKVKAVQDDLTISKFLKKEIVTKILTEDEVKNTYYKAFDERNKK